MESISIAADLELNILCFVLFVPLFPCFYVLWSLKSFTGSQQLGFSPTNNNMYKSADVSTGLFLSGELARPNYMSCISGLARLVYTRRAGLSAMYVCSHSQRVYLLTIASIYVCLPKRADSAQIFYLRFKSGFKRQTNQFGIVRHLPQLFILIAINMFVYCADS